MTSNPTNTTDDGSKTRVDLGAYGAWLFDMDGVLTNTAVVHAAAWKQAFDEFLQREAARTATAFVPFDAEVDYDAYVDGKPREDGVRDFLSSRAITLPEGGDGDASDARTVSALARRKNDLVLEVIQRDGVAAFEGATALLGELHHRGVKVAVVSASENTRAALESAELLTLFDAIVDGNVLKERHLAGKPAPDSFLEGARLLGVEPSRCVVLEDALAGVQSGRAGRFGLVIGVDHHDSAQGHEYADQLRAHGADLVVAALSELL